MTTDTIFAYLQASRKQCKARAALMRCDDHFDEHGQQCILHKYHDSPHQFPSTTPPINYVTIHNAEYISDDTLPLVRACLERAQQHHNVDTCKLVLNTRDKNGWLEFGLSFVYRDGGKLYVGCIQRRPGEEFEFHT